MEKRISVIIVNYKSWEPLSLCLNAILPIKLLEASLEIIVIDNQSNDDRLPAFQKKYPQVNFKVNSGNCGFAHGCNTGVKFSTGNYLLFLNPDTIPTKENLESLLFNYTQYPSLGILGLVQHNENGKKQNYQKPLPSPWSVFGPIRAIYSSLLFSKKTFLNNHIQIVPWITGSCIFISDTWFKKIGGWDTDFWMYSEDIALSKAVWNNNGQVGILLEPSLLHSHGGSSRINPETTALTKLEVMISRHVYIKKYLKPSQKVISHFLTIINHFLVSSLGAFFSLFTYSKPKSKSKRLLLKSLINYYLSVKSIGWESPRACEIGH